MKNDEQKSFAKTTVAITVMVVIGYFALCWAGVVPQTYDIVRNNIGTTEADNSTEVIADTPTIENVVKVSGLPHNEHLNTSTEPNNEITITFRCTSGVGEDIRVRALDSTTNATVYFTGNHRWKMVDNQTAVYMGLELIPYQTATITLHVDGDSHTQSGVIHIEIDAPNCEIDTNHCNGLIVVEALAEQ